MELRVGYKQTELGIIPDDWEVKSISEISNPVRGGSPRPAGDPRYFNGNFIPWLTVSALTNIPLSQIYVSETENYLTEEGSLFSRILEKETLIIANSGATLGVAKLLTIKCCANDGIAALIDFDKNINKTYLVYFINTKIKYLREVVATGNGQPNLNTDLIGNIKVPLPPTKSEQTAVANILSVTDELIENLEKLIVKKRCIKQGAKQQLLLPKQGWEVKKLGEVCTIYGRIGFRGYTVKDIVKEYEGAISLSPSNIVDNELDFNKCTFISWAKYEESPEIKLCVGDIVLVKTASIGKTALVKTLPTKATLNPQIVVLKNIIINNVFLSYLIKSKSIQDQIKEKVVGGVIPTLSQEQIANFLIHIPSPIEQTNIATILGEMDAEIEALEKKLHKYRMIKQGMMQVLLTGKIRLK
jgi:type I restriction enzyme S subunit